MANLEIAIQVAKKDLKAKNKVVLIDVQYMLVLTYSSLFAT